MLIRASWLGLLEIYADSAFAPVVVVVAVVVVVDPGRRDLSLPREPASPLLPCVVAPLVVLVPVPVLVVVVVGRPCVVAPAACVPDFPCAAAGITPTKPVMATAAITRNWFLWPPDGLTKQRQCRESGVT